MQNTDQSQRPGLIVGQNPVGSVSRSKMPGFQNVQQQINELRQTLHTLMVDTQYADGEIVATAATLDAELEDFSRRLADKKQPGLRTF